ncbi:hypothetical protein V6N13_132085 [Hibiscus sabdariffa]
MKNERERSRGRGGGSDKFDALGRLLTLNLNMRKDGYVKVEAELEAVRKDNKQRFSLLGENGVQTKAVSSKHCLMKTPYVVALQTVESESLLKQILSPNEVQYMRRDLSQCQKSFGRRNEVVHFRQQSDAE